jgi:hypothetical protein
MSFCKKARLWVTLSLAICCLGLSACSKSTGGDDGDDGNNPYNILDLRVKSVTDSSITLCWTATGDDGDVGTASSYDLRILMGDPITEDNWGSAYQYPGEPAPSVAGSTDSMCVAGLMEDSTYYFALVACDEATNCSGRSNCASGACFNDHAVDFPDSNLEAVVRLAIGKPTGDIHRLELMPLNVLDGGNKDIADLTGLECCTNLRFLVLPANHVSDITPLAPLAQMLDMDLSQNEITDVGPLARMSKLENLKLRDNSLTDIDSLGKLTSLKYLLLDGNDISELLPLVTLTSLQDLRIEHAEVSNLAPLSGLTHLEQLLLGWNQISDVMHLSTLTSIKVIFLNGNQISEISALLGNAGLDSGDVVQLMVNPLSDHAKTVDIPALQARGVGVTF